MLENDCVELRNEIERLRQEILKQEAERDAMAEEVNAILRNQMGREIDENVVGMVRSALLHYNEQRTKREGDGEDARD